MNRGQFLSLLISGLIAIAGIILTPLWSNITKNWPIEKSKKYSRWILLITVSAILCFIIIFFYPALKNYADRKGYVIQPPIYLRPLIYRKAQGEAVAPRLPFEPPTLPEKQITCDADYCSTFEKEDWEGWTEFRESTKYPGALIPSLEREVFDTSRLWYKKFQPQPAFKIELTVKPYHLEMGNIVISYGTIWRCIIAETDYNTVTCEAEKPFQRLPSKHFTGKEKKSIKPETDVVISIEAILTGEKKTKIIINVDYINIESNKSIADFDFTVSMPTPKPAKAKEYIGVGIIDPKRKDPAVEFKNFKLWKR